MASFDRMNTGLSRCHGRWKAGYEDTNDAERTSVDPAIRHVVGGRAKTKQAASTSQMGLFETEVLTQRENLSVVMDLCGRWIDTVHHRKPIREIILDMHSSVGETYGEQEGSAYNGHFGCTCYHPLFCFNQFGDLERALLREGNVPSAEDWRSVLDPVVARYRDGDIRRFFRGDAAFARPEVYEYLEEERFLYAIRLPGNAVLYQEVEPLLTRPVGRPSNRQVVKFYNGRGTAEQWIKEGKNAVKWTRLSCHDFVDNQVRLSRCPSGFALAYNLGNFLRRLALPKSVKHWSLIPMYIGTAGEAGEDRSQGRSPRPVRDLPTGRGGCAEAAVRGHLGAHSTAAPA